MNGYLSSRYKLITKDFFLSAFNSVSRTYVKIGYYHYDFDKVKLFIFVDGVIKLESKNRKI